MALSKKAAEQLLRSHIQVTPDFPKAGIQFVDFLPLLSKDQGIFSQLIDYFRSYYEQKVDAIAGIDARGFIIGAALSNEMKLPFIPIRKAGKCPPPVHRESYSSEYADAALELEKGSASAYSKVLVVDDVLATGGTAAAAAKLIEADGAKVFAFAFFIELSKLGGRKLLNGSSVLALTDYLE